MMSRQQKDTPWNQLLEEFKIGLQHAIEELKKRDVENIPGAKEALLQRL